MAFAAAAARSAARLLALLLRGPLRALPDREKTRLETQTLAFIAAALRRTAPPSRGRVAVNRRGHTGTSQPERPRKPLHQRISTPRSTRAACPVHTEDAGQIRRNGVNVVECCPNADVSIRTDDH
jgi:hypothetical protein